MTEPIIHAPRAGENPEPAIREVLSSLPSDGRLALDTETTGTAWTDTIRTAQFGTTTQAVVLDMADPNHRKIAADVLAQAPRFVAHNAAFDAIVLAREGLADLDDLMSKMTDTLVLAQLIDPLKSNGTDRSARLFDAPRDLKSLSMDYLGAHVAMSADAKERLVESWKALGLRSNGKAETLGWRHGPVDSPEFIRYAAADVIDAARLLDVLLPVAKLAVGEEVLRREHWLLAATTRMTYRGYRVDAEEVARRREDLEVTLDSARETLTALGIENPNATAQIIAALEAEGVELPKTEKGNRSAKAEVLETLPDSPTARAVLDYRSVGKVVSTYLRPWTELTVGGLLHPGFNTLGSATGRLTMSTPSMLNVPADLRPCIVAEPGKSLVGADFSSVEMRLGAGLAAETQLIADYQAGFDPYWWLARAMYGPDATKAHRQRAKAPKLGRMYGRGHKSVAAQEGIPEREAEALMNLIDTRYPRLKEFAAHQKRRTELGETRRVLHTGRSVQIDPARAKDTMNALVQGTGRELLVTSGMALDAAGLGDALWLPIHDEWVLEVDENDATEAVKELERAMTGAFCGVPIVADAKALGPRWIKGE